MLWSLYTNIAKLKEILNLRIATHCELTGKYDALRLHAISNLHEAGSMTKHFGVRMRLKNHTIWRKNYHITAIDHINVGHYESWFSSNIHIVTITQEKNMVIGKKVRITLVHYIALYDNNS